MWQKATQYHKLPSELYGITNPLLAFLFDNAITACGVTIENALAERVNKGTSKEPRYEATYTLAELLDPIFYLPRPQPEPRKVRPIANNGLAQILALAGQQGSSVKLYKYVGPPN